MEDFAQGYGSPEDMMAPGPMDAQLAGGAPEDEMGGGEGPEAQIAQGVQAFLESQDPQIAVEVVMMLAEQMGMAPGGMPEEPAGAGMPPGGDPMGGGMPMARHGGKFGFFTSNERAGEFMKFVNK